METIRVQWHAADSEWLVSPLDSPDWQPLPQWADNVADLTQVLLILSPVNYATHFVSLPGVSARHMQRALPFALEESLIEDVASYLIVPAGQADKKTRAYVLSADLIERLLEACEVLHLQVRELIPATQLIEADSFQRSQLQGQSGWMIRLPGRFEGWVPDAALTAVCESLFEEMTGNSQSLAILAPQLDQAQLLKTTLETSFPEAFATLQCRVSEGVNEARDKLTERVTNLLVGRFQVREAIEEKPKAWWRPLAAMAAVWLVLATGWMFIEQHGAAQKADQVYSETLALYKRLFPGERIRSLDRQIREKINGGGEAQGDGFLSSVNVLGRVYAVQKLQKQVQIMSLRFNDRLQEVTLEVQAASLAELQTLRAALEKEGLSAEVASATNDKQGVKGRIRIGGAA